jgi:hypothetical protein
VLLLVVLSSVRVMHGVHRDFPWVITLGTVDAISG